MVAMQVGDEDIVQTGRPYAQPRNMQLGSLAAVDQKRLIAQVQYLP
jgi:hypothetical protein